MRYRIIIGKYYRSWFAFFALLFMHITVHSQTPVYADKVSSQDNVDFGVNATDSDLSTKADVRASTGVVLGIESYSGHLELKFSDPIVANTTTYIRIDADDNLFPALLGGSLGNAISTLLGGVLIGNQEFTVQALDGNTQVLVGDSQTAGAFARDRMKLVVNASNEYFIAVTPDKQYDRIRLTNRVGSLLGLGNTKRLGVYGAYYISAPNNCGMPAFTSYDGEGIQLDALNIGGVGVTNPQNILDSDPDNYSRLSMGILSVAGSIEQTVYFEGLSNVTDNFSVRLRLDPSLLTAGVANSIQLIGSNGGTEVSRITLVNLLNADLLTLLQGNQVATIPFAPGAPVDRITILYTSLLNVNLTQRLDLYGVIRTPVLPEIDAASQGVTVCAEGKANLVATANPTNLELRWYDALEGGTLLGTVASGDPFETPVVLSDVTFYVAAGKPGCVEESARVAVPVAVQSLPTASDIDVIGNENVLCASNPVVLVPSSTIDGTFSWYLDEDKTTPITDGLIKDGTAYVIAANGTLTISGLDGVNSPYNYYVSVMEEDLGCENSVGNLKQVPVSIVDNNLAPTITLDADITSDDTININEAAGMVPISGTVGGDAQVGDTVSLVVNGTTYTGTVAGDLGFSILVDGSALVADSDGIIDARVETDNGTCSMVANDTKAFSVDVTSPAVPTVNPQVTNDTTPTITGTADSIDDLSVVVNGVTYTEGDGNLVDNGNDTWTLDIPNPNALPDGAYNVVATAMDTAGNAINDTTTNELVIDTVAPSIPTVSPLITADTTPMISGTADSVDNLTIVVNGVTYIEGDGNLVDNGNNTWTLTIPIANALPDGTYDVAATTADAAGNTAQDDTTDELIINSSAPTNPTVNAQNTMDTTPTITGTADSVDNLTVEVNGVTYIEGDGNLVDNGDDTWSLTIPDANALPDGVYDVKALVTDNSGNKANDGTVNELVIDTIPPTVPTVDTQVTNDTTPTITGRADSIDILTIVVNGVTYTESDGNLTDNGDNTWSLAIPDANALPDGVYDVAVTATDNVGNEAHDATIDELVIDTTVKVPTVDAQETDNTDPIITGTADSTDNLTVMVDGITYTEGDGNLVDNGDDTWSLAIATALAIGTYDVLVIATDALGNTANDATTDELIIMPLISDLTISKVVGSSNPLVGETVTFTIKVVNNGTTNFANVVVDEQLRSGFTYVKSTASNGQYNPSAGVWNITDLQANETATLTLDAKVDPVGELVNTATIASSSPEDKDVDNNMAEVTLTLSCLTVFNEFTPNDDGANDTFRIECIEKYPSSSLQIYNRYGNLVYKASGYKNDWNGVANVGGTVGRGKVLPEGNYFYILKIDELGKDLTGWIYLGR